MDYGNYEQHISEFHLMCPNECFKQDKSRQKHFNLNELAQHLDNDCIKEPFTCQECF
jgi:hypothetical protein